MNIKIFVLLIVVLGSVNLCSASVARLSKEEQEKVNRNLEQAVRSDDLKAAKIALDQGANPNDQEVGLLRCRSIFAYIRSSEMAKLLIECGADVNLVGHYSSYPLDMVDRVDVAQVLINHGARLNDKDRFFMTRLDNALSWNRRNIAKFLMQILGVECLSDQVIKSNSVSAIQSMQKLYAELQQEIQKEQEEFELLIQWSAVQGEKSYAKSRCIGNPDVTEQVKKLMHGFPKKTVIKNA